MSARGRAARRDSNEKPLVRDLRKCGVQVFYISGPKAPDLLCLYGGRWMPLGVKRPKGRKTETEEAGVPWPLVETLAQALTALGVMK